MPLNRTWREGLAQLKVRYDTLKIGKASLLQLIDEAEIAESVYNSNAIENSTLSLSETEKILLELSVSRNVSVREVFEAKNLARVAGYVRDKALSAEIDLSGILLLHTMLLTNIGDDIAGRLRTAGEYVRVGTHIAAPPESLDALMTKLLVDYSSDLGGYFLDRIAKFHLIFETLHPFNDGNGRIGRVLINYQLARLGCPGIIVRNKEKKHYYQAFRAFQKNHATKAMELLLALALKESFHKRLAYLQGWTILPLAEHAKQHQRSTSALLNAAARQTIPAFREKGVWKIGVA